MLFGACADKDTVQDVQAPVGSFEDGAYIGLSLSLPSADNLTRAEATGNDVFSNGTEDEFEVKNATLYIFKLAKTSSDNPDDAATFVAKVSLGNSYDPDTQGGITDDEWGEQTGVADTKITSTYTQATLIPNALASEMKADTDNKYFAYVIINHNGQIIAPTVDATTFKQFSDQTFSKIGADIAAKKNIHETGLLMTNAPICNYAGGQTAPTKGAAADAPEVEYTTLVPLNNQNIFGSMSEAEASPAACVYVERAAVKITVEDNRPAADKKLNGYDVTIEGWQVINNEPTYYNTRHINNNGAATNYAEDWGGYFNADWTGKNTTFRFVTLTPFAPTLGAGSHTTGYRTYFAKDVQYNKDDVVLENPVALETRPWIPLKDADDNYNHAYTTENTFDVKHQTWENTTMVTLKVQIGDGTKGFFTVGKGGQTMYIDDADMSAAGAKSGLQKALDAIENILKADNDVAQALADLRTKISSNNPTAEVASGLKLTADAPVTTGTTQTPGTTAYTFNVALDYTINNVAYTAFTGEEATLKTQLENKIKAVMYVDPAAATPEYADAVQLNYYKGGVSYYNVRIKHFGDQETPWSGGGTYVFGGGNGVNEIYFGVANDATPTDEQVEAAQNNFLGRYGVVRDNWYKLSVDKIGKIGDAQPVDPSTVTPDTPDDEIENFISVHVHIVPWVLRSQSVQF